MNNNKLKNSEKIWSRQFVFVLVATFVCNITMTMMMPIMPMYLKKLGQAMSLSGIVVGVFTFAALLCRPLWGKLLDVYSRKAVLVVGCALIALMCFAYRFADGIALLLVMRIIHGIGYAAATNATGTIAADLVPPARRSEGLGYYGVAFAGSLALGPALSLQIVNTLDLYAVFLAAGCFAVVGLLLALPIQKTRPVHSAPIQTAGHAAQKQSILEMSAIPASLVMALVAFDYSAVMTFVPSYSMSLGLGGMSLFFLLYAVTLLLCRLFIGKYTDQHGMLSVLVPGILLMAASFVFLALARTTLMFILAAVLFGMGYGTVQPTLNAIVIARCAPSRRGAANATLFAAMDFGIGLGAVVWGVISSTFGYAAIYWAGLIFFGAAAIDCLLLQRKEKAQLEPVDKIRA